MTSPARRRRRIDFLVAAALAVLAVAAAAIVWTTSDFRATTVVSAEATEKPSPLATAPQSLTEIWRAATDPTLGAVVSPAGTVITADQHGLTGLDARTGVQRWSYHRETVPLCAIASGDSDGSNIRGVLAVYRKNGWCSQVALLDSGTGERRYARTSPNQGDGSLTIGGPYAAWMGPTLIELWRDPLIRTIQYGDLPNPPQPGTVHDGCTFTDIATADRQFATIEHCAESGPHARLVVNYADPDSEKDGDSKGWDTFKHEPRANIDTGSPAAVIVGITRDRVAVLVSAPTPAVVVYEFDGTEISRKPVDIPAADIEAARGITRSVMDGDRRFTLVGDRVLSLSTAEVKVTVTVTPTSGGGTTSSSTAAATTEEQDRKSLTLDWVTGPTLGLPTTVGKDLLVPTSAGLAVIDTSTGNATRTIAVDRAGYSGPVNVALSGETLVETRGGSVVALG